MAYFCRALFSRLAMFIIVAAGNALRYQGHIVSSPTSWYNVWFSTPEQQQQQTLLYPEEKYVSHKRSFGYTRDNGPDIWGLDFPSCAGYSQSPIDLDTSAMLRLIVAEELNWEGYWKQPHNMTLTNTGHTIQVSGRWEDGDSPFVTGGPLEGEYVFAQLHFHWGSSDDSGSEHTVHNISFPMEMHVVHYKRDYGSPQAAMEFEDGLMVASHLFRLTETPNMALEVLIKSLHAIQGAELQVAIQPFPLDVLHLPFEREYVMYSGSLTTPPCNEAVTWLISARPLPLSPNQLDRFRHLTSMAGMLDENFRPVQPRNGRPVFYIS
ncbi:carbonic anhydrase 2 [Anabrus simplex]|uniref:carbonic anhydrase 2 n=1 Tax=Anabrus simplex TaxID=316456 RepID=UPI0035A32906